MNDPCPKCGAPLPVASFGAAVQCKFCDHFAPSPYNVEPVRISGWATGTEFKQALQNGTGVVITAAKSPEAAELRAAVWRDLEQAQAAAQATDRKILIWSACFAVATLAIILGVNLLVH
jgi:hypothetical protein